MKAHQALVLKYPISFIKHGLSTFVIKLSYPDSCRKSRLLGPCRKNQGPLTFVVKSSSSTIVVITHPHCRNSHKVLPMIPHQKLLVTTYKIRSLCQGDLSNIICILSLCHKLEVPRLTIIIFFFSQRTLFFVVFCKHVANVFFYPSLTQISKNHESNSSYTLCANFWPW